MPSQRTKKIARKLLSVLGFPDSELSILFTDDTEIQKLNNQYRSKDTATDVLSFPQESSIGDEVQLLGDVVISLPTAEIQARELEVSLEEEVLRLLIHGVLHLCGYEHEEVSEQTAEEMRSKENELFDQCLGFLGK